MRIRWILCDSGFGEEDFLEHLESENRPYIIALRLTPYVLAGIRGIIQWRQLRPGLEVAETVVALSTCKKVRRLVVIRKELKQDYGWHEFNVHSFWGTEAAMLLIGVVCYNLVHHSTGEY